MPLLLLALFFFSGLATLVYEVVWLKLLAGVLSNSSHVLSLVLAGFLLGLAFGSRLAGRRERWARRPIRAYACLEMGVAGLAAGMPFLLRGAAEASLSWLPAGVAQGLRLLLCGLLMLLATIPIGATFPLQVAAFLPSPRTALRASAFILSFQTAGGMAGVFLSGFLWLPAYGIQRTHWIAVALSALVSLAALVISRREPVRDVAPPLPENTRHVLRGFRFPLLCGVVGLAGGASLALEVFYTRILSFFLPDLAWSFSAMLGVYLFAVALGAFLATRLARRLTSLDGAGVLALVAGALVVASLAVVPWLHGLLHRFEDPSGGFTSMDFLVAAVLGSALLVGPAAAGLAAFLPLGIGLLAPGRGTSPSAGAAYSANSLGSAAGALLAGMVLVPALGIRWGVVACGLVVMGAGVVLFACDLAALRTRWPERAVAGLCVVSLCWSLPAAQPSRPLILDSGVFRRSIAEQLERRLLEEREGSVAVASVVEEKGQRTLYTDAFQAAGTGETYQYMKMLGHVPMLLAEEPRNVLVIAFGTGTTAGSVSLHPALERLTLVEISPEVLELAPYFEAVNFGLPQRVPEGVQQEVVVDDGRAFLRRTGERFDVITLEPLLPRTPAAIHFYTTEFFHLAARRLTDAGVLCHWVPLHGQPLSSLQSILRSFSAVFPACHGFVFDSNLVLLGWKNGPPPLDREEVERRLRSPPVAADLARAGVASLEHLLAASVTGGAALHGSLAGASPVTDDRPTILYAAIRPNIEHLRYHAEAIRFLLENRAAEPFGAADLDPAAQVRVQDLRVENLRHQEEVAAQQERRYRAFLQSVRTAEAANPRP